MFNPKTKALAHLGWRNLQRNFRRTLITTLVVSVGLIVLMFSFGLLEGFVPQMIEGGAKTLNGHILIHAKGYFQKKDVGMLMSQTSSIEKILRKEKRIEHWSSRIAARGLLGSAENVHGIKVIGLDPLREKEILSLFRKIKKGHAPKEGLKNNKIEVLLSQKIARKLDISLGNKVVLRVSGAKGEMVSIAMQVTGIYDTGSAHFDNFHIFVHRKEASRLLHLGGSVHQYVIMVKNYKEVQKIVRSLQQKLHSFSSPLEIMPWWKTSPEIKAMVDFSDISLFSVLFFIFPIVLLGCLNTMLMSAFERTREIGIMKAIGTRRSHILFLFFWEAFFLGGIGIFIGFFVGLAINLTFESLGGVSLRMFMRQESKMMVSGIALEPVMWIKTTPIVLWLPALSIFISILIASLYPAWRTSRLQPAKAIQFES